MAVTLELAAFITGAIVGVLLAYLHDLITPPWRNA